MTVNGVYQIFPQYRVVRGSGSPAEAIAVIRKLIGRNASTIGVAQNVSFIGGSANGAAMRALIVYYSLSGTTAKVAEALAKALDGERAEIRCDRYRSGIVSYFRAGYDSLKGRTPQIELPASVDQPSDLMIVAAPLWAGHLATPMRAFLVGNHKLPEKVGLVLTRGGSSPDTAFTEMEAHLPAPAKAKLTLTEKEVKAGTFTEPLKAFVAELNGATDNTFRRQA